MSLKAPEKIFARLLIYLDLGAAKIKECLKNGCNEIFQVSELRGLLAGWSTPLAITNISSPYGVFLVVYLLLLLFVIVIIFYY